MAPPSPARVSADEQHDAEREAAVQVALLYRYREQHSSHQHHHRRLREEVDTLMHRIRHQLRPNRHSHKDFWDQEASGFRDRSGSLFPSWMSNLNSSGPQILFRICAGNCTINTTNTLKDVFLQECRCSAHSPRGSSRRRARWT